MYKNYSLVFALICMYSGLFWAQEVKLDVLSSGSKIRIGEPLTLTITASYTTSQIKLQWPTTQTNDADPVTVLNSSLLPARMQQQNNITAMLFICYGIRFWCFFITKLANKTFK